VLGLINLPTNEVSRRRRIPVIQAHGLFRRAGMSATGAQRAAATALPAFVWTSQPLAGGRHLYLRDWELGEADVQDATRSPSGGLVFVD
jgi:hypothetical protein